MARRERKGKRGRKERRKRKRKERKAKERAKKARVMMKRIQAGSCNHQTLWEQSLKAVNLTRVRLYYYKNQRRYSHYTTPTT